MAVVDSRSTLDSSSSAMISRIGIVLSHFAPLPSGPTPRETNQLVETLLDDREQYDSLVEKEEERRPKALEERYAEQDA